jgi:hypothetical protein
MFCPSSLQTSWLSDFLAVGEQCVRYPVLLLFFIATIGLLAPADVSSLPPGSTELIRALLFRWDGVPASSLLYLNGVTQDLLNQLEKSGQVVISNKKTTVHLVAPLLHFYWCTRLRTSSSTVGPQSIDDLVDQLIACIDPDVLQTSLSRAPEKPLLEAAWQFEIYRAAHTCFPLNINISPGFGHGYGTEGAVDFLVNGERGWAIEIMREGDRRKTHLERFQPVCHTHTPTHPSELCE